MTPLIECVPNFSEGCDISKIKQITDEISTVEGTRLLDVDPGKATNRTVVTFAGTPDAVVEAAFRAIKKAGEVIDMSKHKGEHPRMGATDVCPFVPLSGATMEDAVACAKKLAKRVGEELGIPVYLYEAAAVTPQRTNLADIRAGEYEGLPQKVVNPEWKPDFGPAKFNAKSGATVIGARNFLVAYNVNLNTTSTRRANSVAFDIREAGRVMTDAKGKNRFDEKGDPVRIPGKLKAVKAIGWYIEEYGIAQISINLTDINVTPVHVAFDEVCKSADSRGLRVTGSELVGLIPLNSLLEAGRYYLKKQQRSVGVSEKELIKIAVKSLGLDDLKSFHPNEKIIEYILRDKSSRKLVSMTLDGFADEAASESPAPGGGSVAAYTGALGVSLATMVANLSSHKRGWEDRWEEFSGWAEKGQHIKDTLLALVDEDTAAFNKMMFAFGMPKTTDSEKADRTKAIQDATRYAMQVPFRVMELSYLSMEVIKAMAERGNPNSASDAGVAALCARTAVMGAFLNVKINASGLGDKIFTKELIEKGENMVNKCNELEKEILKTVVSHIS